MGNQLLSFNINCLIFVHGQSRQLQYLYGPPPILSPPACKHYNTPVTPSTIPADSALDYHLVVSPHTSTCRCLPLYAQQRALLLWAAGFCRSSAFYWQRCMLKKCTVHHPAKEKFRLILTQTHILKYILGSALCSLTLLHH